MRKASEGHLCRKEAKGQIGSSLKNFSVTQKKKSFVMQRFFDKTWITKTQSRPQQRHIGSSRNRKKPDDLRKDTVVVVGAQREKDPDSNLSPPESKVLIP